MEDHRQNKENIMEIIYLNSPLEVKGMEKEGNSEESILKIAGYANYSSKDRGNEVISPDAWTKGLTNYKKNPIVLFAHDHKMPIGTCTNMRVDSTGLYIEANISSAAEKLYGTQTLIKDGALKTFSVGFIPKKGRKDTSTDTLYITELELLENSVVSVPMQQDSVFSVVKSLEKAGDLDKFMTESVELFDSSQEKVDDVKDLVAAGVMSPTEKATVNIEINVADTSNETEIHMMSEEPMEPEETMNSVKTFMGKSYAKMDSKKFEITKFDVQKGEISLQEVTILGNPIGEILNIDIDTLNILNLTKVDTSDYVVFKMVEKRSDADVSKLFAELVNADIKALKLVSTDDRLQLPDIAKKQLSHTIELMDKPIKNWNPDDYIVANKIVDYILSRSQLEADSKELLMLHGHVEENSEMTQLTVSENAADDVVQQAASVAVEAAPAFTTVVSEPKALELVKKTGEAMENVANAKEGNASATQIKALEDRLEQFMAQYKSQSDRIAAANNEKLAFATQSSKPNQRDIAKAVILAYGRNPGAPLTMNSFGATKYGAELLASHKATITTVDVLINSFTTELYEQMQIELKIANMLPSMDVNAQHFKIPVADEDTNGDIAQFANGTYNVGETDSTRVPTTRQNSITAVDLTPHKFMGTTHLAKDEQEDVIIPLLDFQVRSLVRRMARAVDKSLLRGDGSLSGFTASPTNAITVGVGYQSVITGIASLASTASLEVHTGGTSTKATPTTIATARAMLGRYGLDVGSNNLVYLTTIEGYNDLVTTSDFRTMDKFGDKATYITGQIGSIYGIPVVITEFLDVVGVSGNQVGLMVYLPGFLVGRRRAFEIESYYDPRRQLTAVYLSTRFDMKALTTNASAALDTTKYSTAVVVTSET